jgi:hypothetical protein
MEYTHISMPILEYHTRNEGFTKSRWEILSSDGTEIGKFLVTARTWQPFSLIVMYEENGLQLFSLSLEFEKQSEYCVKDIDGNPLWRVDFNPFNRKAEIFDGNDELLCRAKPTKRPLTDLPVLRGPYNPAIGYVPYRGNLIGGFMAIVGIAKLFYGSPGWVQVTDLSDQILITIKHEGARKAVGMIDDSKIDRRLGLVLLLIYSYV